jgi:hypothetical protein
MSGFVLSHLGVASAQCSDVLLDVALVIQRRAFVRLRRFDVACLHALLA